MTTTVETPTATVRASATARRATPGSKIVSWLTTTDHKVIGYMYLRPS